MNYDPYDIAELYEIQYKKLADAEAQLSEVEMLKSIIKATELLKSQASSLGLKEAEATASEAFKDICKAIVLATKNAKNEKGALDLLKIKWETWRTEQANNRQIEKYTR
jgi:uncharacterized protein YutE (UPF0331/DUF86 family)